MKRIITATLAAALILSNVGGCITAYAGGTAKADLYSWTKTAVLDEQSQIETAENEIRNEGDKKNYIVLTEENTDKKDLATDIVEIVEETSNTPDNAVEVLEDKIESEDLTKENRKILDEKGMLLLSINEDEAEEIEKLDDVIAVEEDIELFSSEEEEDVSLGVETEDVSDWNKEIIKINETPQSEENKVKIAILDSGINLIADIDVAKSFNLVENEQDLEGMFMDGTGHGTAIAGIIAAKDDGRGITGINPNAEIYSVRVLDSNNRCTLSRLIAGIHKAEELGSDIVCMSLGTRVRSVALERAVKEADEKGLLLIAAAGNSDVVEYPAAYDDVIAVGGINSDGRPCTESSEKEEVEILAPGEDVPVTDTFFEADYKSGTSMAVPHVAGIASLLWEKDRSVSADFIRSLLQLSESKVEGNESGVLNYEYALSVFDEYRNTYQPNDDIDNSPLLNSSEVRAVDVGDDVVEARWRTAGHKEAITDSTAYKNKASIRNHEKALLKGAIIADEFYKGTMIQNGQEVHYPLHGGQKNFIAFYMYICNVAQAMLKCDDYNTVLRKLDSYYPVTPTNDDGFLSRAAFETVACALNDIVVDWNTKGKYKGEVLEKNKENIAYLYLGVAIHLASDSFAHRALVKLDNGEWEMLVKLHKTDENMKEDETDVYPARFQAAKIVVDFTLYDFIKGTKVSPDNFFFEKKLNGNSVKAPAGYGGDRIGNFRMKLLQRCANQIDLKYDKKLQKYSYGD